MNMETLLLILLLHLGPVLGELKFIEHPQYAVALPGDAVYFNCKTNHVVADEKIRWLHNGTLIPQFDQDYKYAKGVLSFQFGPDSKTYLRQVGTYQCVTSKGENSFASLPAMLSVAYLGDFGIAKTREIEIFDHNNVAIKCEAPISNPPAFIQFYKDNELIEDASSPKVQFLNGDILLLVNATSQSDAGKYTCSASNHITNQKKTSPVATILKFKSSDKQEKSKLTFWPNEKYQVPLGENFTIPCVASGNPKPLITWTRLGNKQRIPSENGCLEIRRAQEIDTGGYLCELFNGSRRFLRRTSIEVLVPPVFTKRPKAPQDGTLKQGDSLSLHCQALGTPVPTIEWYFNGLPVLKGLRNVMPNGTLHVPFVRNVDEGMYQCFAINSQGKNFSNAFVRVQTHDPVDDEETELWHKQEFLDHLATVPPSRPNITQSARHSVLLTWDIQSDEQTMPIQFFRVQFREFARGKRSDWRTLDEIIHAPSRSFEVMGLRDEVRYRFRIAVVYANNDNLHGPSSKKFKLDQNLDSDEAPQVAPVITQVLPLSESSLKIGWSLNTLLSQATIEGYFIYLRKSSLDKKREFRKVTIIGHESHSYIFDDLEPATFYEIKVAAFNFAGISPTSKLAKQRTNFVLRKQVITKPHNFSQQDISNLEASNDLIDNSKVLLYMVLSGVVIGVVFILVIFCSVLSCYQKRKARKCLADGTAQIHQKYADTSRHINFNHHDQRIGEHQLYSSSSHTAETSFSSPHSNPYRASNCHQIFNYKPNNL